MSRKDVRPTTLNKKSPVAASKPDSPHELKKTEFSLKAHSAKSVKLAGDFTDWEKSALAMSKAENGVWRVEVPLASGNYSYRFLVDGEWSDDPQCDYRIPNSFGSHNATRKVA